jgi:hypothetical protein
VPEETEQRLGLRLRLTPASAGRSPVVPVEFPRREVAVGSVAWACTWLDTLGMTEDEGEIPSVTQRIEGARDVFAAARDIHYHGDSSYEDFIKQIEATSPDEGYKVFWSGLREYRIRALNGGIAPSGAAEFIARRASEEDGVHLQECVDLLYSVNRDTARKILRLGEKLARRILVGMGDGLGVFLSGVSDQSVSDAASFLYLVASDDQFRDSVRALFAADSAAKWREAWINQLEPDRAAFLLSVVGVPWPRELLPAVPPLRAAQITLSEHGSGRWLSLLSEPGRSAVLAEGARHNPVGLAHRLLENRYPEAKKLVSVVSRDPGVFHGFLNALDGWHPVVFAAMADLTLERGDPLLDRMRVMVEVWPWLAARRAVQAVAPGSGRIRIWWRVRSAAATWTPDRREQRQRDVRMFAAGVAVTLAVWILLAIF